MKIGQIIGYVRNLLSWVNASAKSVAMVYGLVLFIPSSVHAFDRFENWGFDQGGGYRMGSFTDEDAGLTLTSVAAQMDDNLLAVGGALGNDWAVRIYFVEPSGPELIGEWTGAGAVKLEYSTVTSMIWVDGLLACGVEHLKGGGMDADVLFLDPEKPESLVFAELGGWDSLSSLRADPLDASKLWVLGTRNRQTFCRSINSSNEVLDEFRMNDLTKPRAMLARDDKIWICGENEGGNSFVNVFIDGKRKGTKPLGPGHFVSAMEASGPNVYLTGRRKTNKNRKEMEDFFLVCLAWDEQRKNISEEWEVETETFDDGLDREVGTALLPLEDGGVVVAGNFRRYWKLGPTSDGKLALLPPDTSEGVNFEAFLARYDEGGDIVWAQTSGMPGDDFSVALARDAEGGAFLLGNRIIGGGFGPYLSKLRLGGHDERNAPLVDRDLTNAGEISWHPPKILRLGEPVSGAYLSARSPVRLKFEYFLNDELVTHGDLPMFEPGELELRAGMEGGGNVGAVRMVKGLKGRPYLKVDYEQVGNEIFFLGELSGLHPAHLLDEEKNEELHERVQFEMVQDEDVSLIEGGRLILEDDFTGRFEVEATFLGDLHYEPATRRISLQARSGKLFKPGDEAFNSVSIRVKDLDGWQKERLLPRGQQTFVAATQGFGRKRKFKRWVEFSQEDERLTTARVEAPFSLRTALFAEEDMTLFAKYSFSFAGAAVNGYLAGSSVFLDYNLNGQIDEGEPTGFTTENGGFEIEVSEEEFLANDTNGNGMIDLAEGVIVVLGGMDRASGLPLAISYKAPPSYSVITAISTVVAEISSTGKTLEESEQIISQFLDLPEGINLSTFEPLGAVFTNEEEAQAFILRATQLSNLLNEGSRYIEMTTGNRVDRVDAASLIVASITDQIMAEVEQGSGESGQSLSLNDSTTLVEIISAANEEAQVVAALAEEEDGFQQPTSVRAELTEEHPEIAQSGNTAILDRLVAQLGSANDGLEQMAGNPEVSPQDFKALASASQNVLDELGEDASNALSAEEVTLLEAENEDPAIEQLLATASVEELGTGGYEDETERTERFSLNVLDDIRQNARMNIYAPRFEQIELTAPNAFSDNLVVGRFTASDPEGSDVIFTIVGENPDLDGDEVPILSINENTGEVRVRDYDDLKLMNADLLSPILRVTDAGGLYAEKQTQINVAEWAYLAGRKRLADFNTGTGFNLREQMPAGTLVGQFVTNDPDDGKLSFTLVSGDGDSGNRFFSLSQNGDLKSKQKFDYARKASYLIRVRSTNQRGKTHQKVIEVRILEGFVPILDTMLPNYRGNGKYRLGGVLLDPGIIRQGVKVGVLISANPIVPGKMDGVLDRPLSLGSGDSFAMEFSPDAGMETIYVMAYARNEKGRSYGLMERVEVDGYGSRVSDYLTSAKPMKNAPGWWTSDWFGTYYLAEASGWILHMDLGWLYPSISASEGIWIWKEALGWVWTNRGIYPYLFSSNSNAWLYFYGELDQRRLLYDYKRKKWIRLDETMIQEEKDTR